MTGISKVGVSSSPQLSKFTFSKAFLWQGQGLEIVRGCGASPLWLLATWPWGVTPLLGHAAPLLMLLNSQSFLVHG